MKHTMKLFGLASALLFTYPNISNAAAGCCCQDCVCPPGTQGPVGPQGVQGIMGFQGTQGNAGSTGPQGIMGIPGTSCQLINAYTSVYSLVDQTLLSGQNATFELISDTTPYFDVTMAPATGEILVLQTGNFLIEWEVDGTLLSPYPAPVPAWSFGIYVNGIFIPASASASFTSSPNDLTRHNSGAFIMPLLAGDVIALINTSTVTVQAVAEVFGSLVPVISAKINLIMVGP